MPLVEIRSVTISEKGQIAIPKQIRELGGFKEGTKLAVLAYKDRVELRPITQMEERMDALFATEKVLAKDWNSKEEDKAWKNL